MTELLRPYVPSLVIDWLRDMPGTTHRRVEGAFVFADISGFTNLTERLAQRGKVGAEEMGDLLNDTFESLLIPAYEYGGALVKWGGDAVLLLFQDEGHLERAARAAVEMQRVIKRVGKLRTSAGVVTLRMSVGVHCGSLDFFLVGSDHRELVVVGPDATEVAEMEKVAEAGEIVLSAAAAARLDSDCLGDGRLSGRLLAKTPEAEVRPRTTPDTRAMPDLAAAIPLAVRDYLLSGAAENEHRQVTAGFVLFSGADAVLSERGAEALATELGALIDNATEAADRFGVTVLGTDIGGDGGKVIFLAGAPRTRGDGEDRLLAALRQVLATETSLVLRAGANTGRVFAGDFGPPYRRTYSVVGDSVNLAARLMAHAAEGQLVVTQSTVASCRTPFRLEPLPPFRVKGKTEPIDAVTVGEPVEPTASGADDAFPFLGREREVDALHLALAQARGGTGRLVEIVAEAGLGKSRLVDEAFDAIGVGRLQVACDVYETSTPYAPLQRFLRGLLALEPEATGANATARLREVVESRCPRLLPWLPLVGAAAGIAVDSTPEVDALAEKFRRPRLGRAVVELISSVATEPSVFVFEDAHHMDDASAEILHLLDDVLPMRPWLLVITRRPTASGLVARDEPHVSSMWLTPLSDAVSDELLDEVADELALPEHELAQIRESSGGNPLFLRELLAARQQIGSVEALPDSLEGVIAAQIDALPGTARRLLCAAAVLGMTVDRPMLEELLAADDVGIEPGDWHALDSFLAAEGVGLLRFRHALVREAAYETLPFRRRRALHGRAGDALERVVGDAPEEELPSLSFHFFSAQRYPEALRYSRLAGERARAKYAKVEAAQFYTRAVESARAVPGLPAVDQAEITETLGQLWFDLGELAKADDAYRAAYRQVRGEPVFSARLRLDMARVSVRAGRYPEALRLLSLGLRKIDGIDAPEAVAWSARLSVQYAHVRHMQGRERDTLRWAQAGADKALDVNARDALAQAYQLIDWAYMTMGRFDQAEYAWRALSIWEELGDLAWQAAVLNHLGMRSYYLGDWTGALDYYERTRDTFERVGDQWRAAVAAWNISEMYIEQGRLTDGEEMTRRALRVFRASATPSYIAGCEALLGRIAAREGRYDEALQLLNSARVTYAADGDEPDVVDTDARIAECLVLDGRTEEALRMAESVIAGIPDSDGLNAVVPLLHRVRGLALAQRGALVEARAALEASLVAARLRKSRQDVALTIDALTRVARIDGTAVHPTLVVERDDWFAKLGIVAAPAISLPGEMIVLPQPRPVAVPRPTQSSAPSQVTN